MLGKWEVCEYFWINQVLDQIGWQLNGSLYHDLRMNETNGCCKKLLMTGKRLYFDLECSDSINKKGGIISWVGGIAQYCKLIK